MTPRLIIILSGLIISTYAPLQARARIAHIARGCMQPRFVRPPQKPFSRSNPQLKAQQASLKEKKLTRITASLLNESMLNTHKSIQEQQRNRLEFQLKLIGLGTAATLATLGYTITTAYIDTLMTLA